MLERLNLFTLDKSQLSKENTSADFELDLSRSRAAETVLRLRSAGTEVKISIDQAGNFQVSKNPKFSHSLLIHYFMKLFELDRDAKLTPKNLAVAKTLRSLYQKIQTEKVTLKGPLIVMPQAKSEIIRSGEVLGFKAPAFNPKFTDSPCLSFSEMLNLKIYQDSLSFSARGVSTHLAFVFSDLTMLRLDEIIYHPYSLLLPEKFISFLEALHTPRPQKELTYFEDHFPSYDQRFIARICDDMINLLNDFPLYVAASLGDDHFMEFLRFKRIHAEDMTVHFFNKAEALCFEIDSPFDIPEAKRIGSLIVSPGQKSLYQLSSIQEKRLSNLGITFSLNEIVLEGIIAEGFMDFLDQETYQGLVSILDLGHLQLNYDRLKSLPEQAARLKLELTTNDPWAVHLSPDNVLNYWEGISLFYGINLGLGAVFHADNKYLATQSGVKRRFDLKFLRHQGLYLLLLSEYLRAYTGDRDKKREKLIADSIHHFFETLTEPGKNTSNKIAQILNQWFTKIHLDFSALALVPFEGEIYQTPYALMAKQYLEVLLEILQDQLSPKQLMKEKNVAFTLKPSNVSQLTLSVEDGLGKVLRNLNPNVDVTVDGKPVSVLTAADFKTTMNLDESTVGADWFSLHPIIFFDGEEISLEESFKFAREKFVVHKGRTYTLNVEKIPALKWLDFFWQRLSVKQPGKKTVSEGSMFHVPKSQTLTLLAMKNAGLPVTGGEKWSKISESFERLTQGNKSDDLSALKETLKHIPLRPFQLEGVLWLSQITDLGLGCTLADDMGLGKTLQTLAFLNLLQIKGELRKPKLIVVPSSIIYNWQKEAEKFTPSLELILFSREMKSNFDASEYKEKILLTTYGLMTEHATFFEAVDWSVIVFDEAQNLKNVASQRTTTARKLTAEHKIALTGTPMENHYGEYFSLIDLVLPGSLGEHAAFMRKYVYVTPKAEDIEFLKLVTKPLVLRRNKSLVLSELPQKTETLLKIDLEDEQKDIYRDVAIAWNENIKDIVDQKGESSSQIEMLTALLRLRQICSYPQLVPEVEYTKIPPKENALIHQVEEILAAGESVLIFTHFKQTLDLLAKRLQQEGHPYFTIHGGLSSLMRKKTLAEFEVYEKGAILLMTLKTGGVGLNLTKASYVIHFEPWWNPAVENQATDRAHRMGQKKPVQVYRYLMKDTVEEKMEELKLGKSKAFDLLFSDADESLSPQIVTKKAGLSKSDFDYLLGIGKA